MRLLLAFAAVAAACTPSTFDHLTGAKENTPIGGLHAANPTAPDPTLAAPRPTAPLSTSYVNSLRPHFKWSLAAGTVGATIEVSKTRDFANPVLTTVATGSDYTPTEDLDVGAYFWRLTGRSDTNPGDKTSPIWLVYVRGGGPNGSSDTPHMGIVDTNSDGHPDVTFSVVEQSTGDDDDDDDAGATTPPRRTGTTTPLVNSPDLWLAIADANDAYAPLDNGILWPIYTSAPVVAAVDIDGDGYGDLMVADLYTPGPDDPAEAPQGQLYPFLGGATGQSTTDDNVDIYQQPFSVAPALAPGDFNGDGYGDVSVAFSNYGAALLGNGGGGGPMMAFASAAGVPNAVTTGPRAVASADLNGDGISDVAFAPFDPTSPIRIANGGGSEFDQATALTFATADMPTRASALGSGDFDGDGVDDIAFTTTLGGKNAVCVHGSNDGVFSEKACWTSTTTDAAADFGMALLGADVDADGKDELLVVSKSGLISLTHTGTGKGFASDDSLFTPTPIAGPKPTAGTNVTVIFPGRPGPARWASFGADGKSFDVYKGTAPIQHVDLATGNPVFVSLGATIR